MVRSLALVVILICIFNSLYAQVCKPVNKPNPRFGVHPGLSFANIWNEFGGGYGASYSLVKYSGNGDIVIDNTGWTKAGQTHTFYISVSEDRNPNLKVQPGDVFHCKYKGLANQVFDISGDASLQNIQQTGDYVTFDIRVTSLKTRANLDRFDFKVSGHIEEIQIMRPGYVLDDPRFLTDECVDYLRGSEALRMLGASACNNTFERTWGNRTPANAPFSSNVFTGREIQGNVDSPYDDRADNPYRTDAWEQGKPAPWEKIIDVCNYLNKDFYINLPVLADENYVAELSKLIKTRLKPSLNVYIEIGNELWNFGGGGAFKGFAMSFAAVHHMIVIENDQTIVGGTNGLSVVSTNVGDGTWWTGGFGAYELARRWPAYRLKKYMDIFAADFGFANQGGVGVKIRAVLAGQLDYGWGKDYWFIHSGLEMMDRLYGYEAAQKYFYGVAIANYINVHDDPTKSISEMISMSVDDIIDELYKTTDERFAEFGAEGDCRTNPTGNCEGNEFEDILALAKQRGLKVMAYEGGHEVNIQRNGQWIPLTNIVAAYNDPRMHEHTLYYMNKWYSWMGYDALFFKNGFFTDKGYGAGYAVAEYEGEISQQYSAYRKIMDRPAPALTKDRGGLIGVTAITEVPGNKIASYDYIQNHRDGSEVPDDWVMNGSNAYIYGRRLDGTIDLTKDIYLIRNETSARYAINLKTTWNSGNAYYNIYLDGKPVKENWLLDQGTGTLRGEELRYSDTLKLDIGYGTHVIHFTKSTITGAGGSINLNAMKFTMLGENPPATPQLVYGDLSVCSGNPSAMYEVSPIDFSVCNYEWSGLPTGAQFLPNTSLAGQGLYKIGVDWGAVPNGMYNLTVIAKNQSRLPGNAWLFSTPRVFTVNISTCGFNINPSSGCAPLVNVSFSGANIAGNVTRLEWDLSSGASPSRAIITTLLSDIVTTSFNTVGVYEVGLKVYKDGSGVPEQFFYNKVNALNCSAPYVVSPVIYCKDVAAEPLIAYGSGLRWYTSSIGGIASNTAPTPPTNVVTTITYWVSQTVGSIETERAKIFVYVTLPPILTLSGVLGLCNLSSTRLDIEGATDYTWSPAYGLSATSGSSVRSTISSTTNYTVTGSSAGGCSTSLPFTITVGSAPIISIIPSSLNVCSGTGFTLTASGSSNYSWQPGNATGDTFSTTLGANTTYTVSGTNSGGCASQTIFTVTVNPNVSLSFGSSPTHVCAGEQATLTVSGAMIYSWVGGALPSNNNIVATGILTTTTTYTVTGSSGGSCQDVKYYTVSVTGNPVLNITGPLTFCGSVGTSVTVSGADMYSWAPGNLTGNVNLLNPSNTTEYTVTGLSQQGCSATRTIPVVVACVCSTPTIAGIYTTDIDQLCSGINSGMINYPDIRDGNLPLSLMWMENDVPMSGNSGIYTTTITTVGGISAALNITNATSLHNGNIIKLVVKNSCNNSITTPGVSIRVNPLPEATIANSTGLCIQEGNLKLSFSGKINGANKAQLSSTAPGFINQEVTNLDNDFIFSIPESLQAGDFLINVNVGDRNNSCSSQVILTVPGVPSIGRLGASASKVCEGESVTFLLVNSIGDIQWLQNNVIVGANSGQYVTGPLATNTTVQVVLSKGSCPNAMASKIINVVAAPAQPIINYLSRSYCTEDSPTPDASSSFSDGYFVVPQNVTVDLNGKLNLTRATPDTDYIIRYVITTDGTCLSKDSHDTIRVKGSTLGQIISTTPNEICIGDKIEFELTAHTGNIGWQVSAQGSDSWVTIDQEYTPRFIIPVTTLSGKFKYRAVVKSVDCEAKISNEQLVKVSSQTNPGVIFPEQRLLCNDFNTKLYLKNFEGSILEWQVSSDTIQPWQTWSAPASDTVSRIDQINDFGQVFYYRALVKSGSCPYSYTQVVKIESCNKSNFLPNVLVPNATDNNSTWNLSDVKLKDEDEVRVFNRYGIEVLFRKGKEFKNTAWDGGNLPAGTYYYTINLKEAGTLTGSITLIK